MEGGTEGIRGAALPITEHRTRQFPAADAVAGERMATMVLATRELGPMGFRVS
jgi:hypothetical protein